MHINSFYFSGTRVKSH